MVCMLVHAVGRREVDRLNRYLGSGINRIFSAKAENVRDEE